MAHRLSSNLDPTATRPVVAMCTGKDCRKRCEFAKMHDALAGPCDIVDVGCVGICSGPVVVVHPGADRPLVFSKLRKKQHRRDLLAVVTAEAQPTESLQVRAVSGSKHASTVKKVRRRIPAA